MRTSRSLKGKISFWKAVGWFLLLGIAGLGALHLTFTYRDLSYFWKTLAFLWAPAALVITLLWKTSRQFRPSPTPQENRKKPIQLPSPGALVILLPMSYFATVGWAMTVDALATREVVSIKGEVVSKDRTWRVKGKTLLSVTLQIPGASSPELFPVGRALYDAATPGQVIEIQYRKGILGFEKMPD